MAITIHTNTASADTDSKNFLANGWHLSVTPTPTLIIKWLQFSPLINYFLSSGNKFSVSTE